MKNSILPLLALASLAACGDDPVTPPPAQPVTSITLAGPVRAKVGAAYPVQAILRDATGKAVYRPITWSLVEPLKGTITPAGILTPHEAGTVTTRAQVDDATASHQVEAYDWRASGDATTQVLRLASDDAIVNRHGTVVYPDLAVLCAAGTFQVVMITNGITIGDALVAYRFNNGAAHPEEWLVTGDAGALRAPGATNKSHKQLAQAIAAHGTFEFAFYEAQGNSHSVTFRVNGLATRLPALLAGCPADS